MKFKAAYKAAKLIKVELDVTDNKIKSIRFTGDFFMYPEEAIRKLENELINLSLEESTLLNAVERFFKRENIITPLIEPVDFVKAIMKAVGRD
ncbi:MAG: lipoate--protein ligase family protein [archaeon GB-1867-035]|nr:lipoate--protein ligase family protein [Candidatus Culexmicrobium profundum]